jgi:uncharacterized RDD family membrane protein YckC
MAQPWKAPDHGEDSLIEQELVTGEAVALDVRPASVILRGAGTIIDWLAYLGLFLLMALIVFAVFGDEIDQALAQALAIAGLVFSLLIVPMLVETLSHGRSLGRWAVGARIVRDDGGATGLRHAFIRALMGVIEIFMTFGGLAATSALLNSRSKRLGDLLAGTYSQHERVPRFTEPTFVLPPGLETWAETVDVGRLPDRLSRRVAQFLRQVHQLSPATRVRLAETLADEVAPFVSPLPAVPPEFLLIGVAEVRRRREYSAHLLERARLDTLAPVLTGRPHDFPNR